MAKRDKRLQVHVGIRLDPRDASWEQSLEAAFAGLRAATAIPVHWNLSALMLRQLQEPGHEHALQSFAIRTNDVLLSMGYAGAPHPLLQVDELRKEVEWALEPSGRRSSGRSGAEKVLKPLEGWLLPRMADLYRGSVIDRVLEAGISHVGVSAARPASPFCTIETETGVLSIFPYVALRELEERTLQTLLREARGAGGQRLFLLLEATRFRGDLTGAVDTLVRLCSRGKHTEITRVDGSPLPVAEPPRSAPAAPLSLAPTERTALLSVNQRRSRRRTNSDVRRILEVWNAPTPLNGHERAREGSRPVEADGIAHMPGEVELQEGPLAVEFFCGEINGLFWDGKRISPPVSSQCYVKAAGITHRLTSREAFSISFEAARGIRAHLHAEQAADAAATRECFFVADFPYMIVTTRVRYPTRPQPLQELAPLEIPIAVLGPGETLGIRGLYPGGESWATRIGREDGPVFLAAGLFLFEGSPGLMLGFPPESEPVIETLRLTVEQRGDQALVTAGCSVIADPADACRYAGMEETFSIYLGAAPETPEDLSRFPQAVKELVPLHALRRAVRTESPAAEY